MSTHTTTPFGFNPFSTPRTPKGYARLSSPDASPLARFNLRGGEKEGLPSLRVWKETCKAFHVNTSDASTAILSRTTTTKKNNTNKSKSKPATSTTANRPYPFGNVMLLEDRDVFSLGADDEEGEFGDSFNVYAHATKRRGVVKKSK